MITTGTFINTHNTTTSSEHHVKHDTCPCQSVGLGPGDRALGGDRRLLGPLAPLEVLELVVQLPGS